MEKKFTIQIESKIYFLWMWYSEKYQVQWWRVMRNASRALDKIPKNLGFVEMDVSHGCVIKNPNWGVVCTCRNPYSRAVSFWILRNRINYSHNQEVSLEKYLKGPNEYFNFQVGHDWDPITNLKKNPNIQKHIIRFENLVEDVSNLPFVTENYHLVRRNIEELTEYKDGYKEQYTIDIQIPYSEYYTQELADIVWEKKQYEFEYWGYERDSWKTLIR